MNTRKVFMFKKLDISEMTTIQLILEVFSNSPSKVFHSQSEIAQAICKIGKTCTPPVTRKQSSVSKALKKMDNVEYVYKGSTYRVCELYGDYFLSDKATQDMKIKQHISKNSPFSDPVAYEIAPAMILYKTKKAKFVKDSLLALYEKDLFLDFILRKSVIYLILNPNHPDFARKKQELLKFPKEISH